MNHIDREHLELRVDPEPVHRSQVETADRIVNVLLIAGAVVVGIVIAAALLAAPREGRQPPSQVAGLRGAPHGSGDPLARAGKPLPIASERRDEETAGGAPRYRGEATHYCLPGQRGTAYCTRGYGPDDLVAAIDSDLGFRKGDVVLVRSLLSTGGSVRVRIVDVCGCPGERLIDLTSGAFRRLAPLGLGVIPVTVELAGAERTLPPTDEED